MLKGKIKAFAILQNPQGLWEEEFPVEYPVGGEIQPLTQLAGMLSGGLVRVLGKDELELIPINRVVSVSLKLTSSQIDITSTMPAPRVAQATSGNALRIG